MFQEILQSAWLWPTLGISLVAYYAWVFLTYFRSGFTLGISRDPSGSPVTKTKLQLTWDELAMGFAIHRRLMADPLCALDMEEKALLGKSPFKELIQQTTIR